MGGIHVPWQNRIAANTVLAEVDGHALRQTDNPRFGCAIGCITFPRASTVDG
jgi:hypothetical protein